MLTEFDGDKHVIKVETTTSTDYLYCVKSEPPEVINGAIISPALVTYSGVLVNRLAAYERTGYEPADIMQLAKEIKETKEENEILRKRLSHLLESDFINSFDEKDFTTKEYKRDIKEADKLTAFAETKRDDFSPTIIQLQEIIAIVNGKKNRAAAVGDDNGKEIYSRDIIALETAIKALNCHVSMLDICDNNEKTIASLKAKVEQAKKENELFKHELEKKDEQINRLIDTLENFDGKFRKLKEVFMSETKDI